MATAWIRSRYESGPSGMLQGIISMVNFVRFGLTASST